MIALLVLGDPGDLHATKSCRRAAEVRGYCGQSLVEFALTVPIILLIMLFAIDFGRVFLGWV